MAQLCVLESQADTVKKSVDKFNVNNSNSNARINLRRTGETYKEVTNSKGLKQICKFVRFDVTIDAKVAGWDFVGCIERTQEGNAEDSENKVYSIYKSPVPKEFYKKELLCHCCGKLATRQNRAFLFRDTIGNIVQTNRTCIKKLAGRSQETLCTNLHNFLRPFLDLAKVTDDRLGNRYFPSYEMLKYITETVRAFGYTDHNEKLPDRSTFERAMDYYIFDAGGYDTQSGFYKYIESEKNSVGFDVNSPENEAEVDKILNWLDNVDMSTCTEPGVVKMVQAFLGRDLISEKELRLMTKIMPIYNSESDEALLYDLEQENSEWVGRPNDKIVINVKSCKCVKSWEKESVTELMYEIIDIFGNVFLWKTDDRYRIHKKPGTITAVVKKHDITKTGIKRTELTRCRSNKFVPNKQYMEYRTS